MEKNVITAYFEADHDRLDQLFRRFQNLKRRDYPAAKRFFRNFRAGLRRHISWEEQVLFPFFEKKSGMGPDAGPTAVMRAEHRLIGGFLESIHDKVRVADPGSEEQEQAMLEILGGHNMKEENVLYPALDQMASEEEVADIFAAMAELPEDAGCCGSHAAATPAQAVVRR